MMQAQILPKRVTTLKRMIILMMMKQKKHGAGEMIMSMSLTITRCLRKWQTLGKRVPSAISLVLRKYES